ncbi:MAG TPA: cation transporter [Ilumatobacteraceae bacterium]|nr:cation transporter [Ilumatobacteraceae bacterium]
MAAADVALERHALLWSMVITAVLGAMGVLWGVATESQMILLDGVYAVLGLLVTWLLLMASGLAQSEPSHRYPYGRESLTPLVIGVQGFVLLATLGYAAVDAVLTIRNGGSSVDPGWAIVYSVLTTAGSLVTWLWLRSKASTSDVLGSESTAWKIGALRGAGMIAGFTLLAVIANSSLDWAGPYIDPVMVLITCAVFIPAPIGMVRVTIVELLEGAPSAEIQAPVRAAIDEVRARFDLAEPTVLMSKVGPKLYVEIDGVVDPDVTVAQEHEVRLALAERLDALPYDIWLTAEFSPRSPGVEPARIEGGPGPVGSADG